MSGWPSGERFRARFLERSSEILSAVDVLLSDQSRNNDEYTYQQLKEYSHWLAGTGGTFGYLRVSELGREAEKLCENLQRVTDKRSSPEFKALLLKYDSIRVELGASSDA